MIVGGFTPLNQLKINTQATLHVLYFNCMCTGSLNLSTRTMLPYVRETDYIPLTWYTSCMPTDVIADNGITKIVTNADLDSR